MYDNDHVPTPPPLYGHELSLLVIGDDSNEGNHQLQGKAQREDAPKANRCRCCPMWPELLCERPDCRHAPRDGNRRE